MQFRVGIRNTFVSIISNKLLPASINVFMFFIAVIIFRFLSTEGNYFRIRPITYISNNTSNVSSTVAVMNNVRVPSMSSSCTVVSLFLTGGISAASAARLCIDGTL